MFAVKGILLQVLLAGITPLLFTLFLGRLGTEFQEIKKKTSQSVQIQRSLLLSCLIMIFLCFLFSTVLLNTIYLNLSLIPVILSILYGTYPIGIFVSIVSIISFFCLTDYWTEPAIFLGSGALLYPVLILFVSRFKKANVSKKKMMFTIIWLSYTFLCYGFVVLKTDFSEHVQVEFAVYSLLYIFSSLVVLLATIHLMEKTLRHHGFASELEVRWKEYRHQFDMNEHLLNTVPVSVVAFDTEGNIVNANTRMLAQMESSNNFQAIPPEEMIGKRIETIIGEEHGLRVTERIQSANHDGEISSEYLRVGANTFYTTISPVKDPVSGRVIGSSLVLQDMTELETLRNELAHVERLGLVGQMAASITHEVRNPMAVVRGFLQLMREKSPRSLDHYYRIVMEELDRANSIINDFLSLAQNQASEKEEVHLHHIIKELTPLLLADANMRGQTIELNLCDEIPSKHVNPKEIKQLILNLARNGMEAMGNKGTLIIGTALEEGNVKLSVSDNGPGISLESQNKLFEPFYTTKSKGTGLGLSLCLGIAERHNATICIDSEEGKGTTFTVIFKNG
ncbi:ATP-binding protein [Paenibacillus sp. Marseille-Q4541]|uniref:two-component system sensor histidine kinase NtrB n=1 Tax=Paenibacillus sp. Marseille-Q4541 TaxID=2831522 RepID=UPI001BAAA29A|nr:ATP-binding protein [Paenibacillus sp. Marseille-Q4541]